MMGGLLKNFLSVHSPRVTLVFVHHLAAPPESLGIIAWLLHCGSLAACAKAWLSQGLACLLP
jgi:hypothetical protein